MNQDINLKKKQRGLSFDQSHLFGSFGKDHKMETN